MGCQAQPSSWVFNNSDCLRNFRTDKRKGGVGVFLFGLGWFFPDGKEGESNDSALTARRKAGLRHVRRKPYLQSGLRCPGES